MRIAFLLSSFPVVSETFILRQITGLIDLGHEVDIYAARRPNAQEAQHPQVSTYALLERTTYVDEQMPEVSGVWEMPVRPILGQTWLPGAEHPIPNMARLLRAVPPMLRCGVRFPRLTREVLSPRAYGYQAESLSTLYRLDKLREDRGPYDVVHAHFGPAGSTFRFARELWNAPLVVAFHGYDYTSLPKELGPALYAPLFETVDLVTVNSGYARARLVELGCPNDRIRQLNYGVDLSDFAYAPRSCDAGEPIRLLSVGRLVEKKGLEDAIRAVAQLSKQHPNLRYDIIGEGPLRLRFEGLIRELELAHLVTLHGAQPTDVVRNMMARAHLFLLPSVTAPNGDQEGTPVSLMEAQASGLPVLSTRHSGIPEVVLHERTGFLVPERDPAALAEALGRCLDQPEAWARLGRAGRAHIEANYDIAVLNRRLAGLYADLVEGRRYRVRMRNA